MKVNNTERYRLVFSISRHPKLGPLIAPYVVALTHADTLSLTYQKVFSGNATHYTNLSDEELEWIAILDDTRPERIVKIFSQEQKIRPKEYFAKHFKKETFDRTIRPFIDEAHTKLIRALPEGYSGLYTADEINPAARPVRMNHEFTKILFHLRRNENGTNYFATIKHGDQRIPFMKLGGLMLSKKPAILTVSGELYKFYDFVDGARLAIFLNRKFVHVPPEKEKTYYGTFVKKLMETSPVFGQGFVIEKQEHQAKINLVLFEVGEKVAFKIELTYGDFTFWYGNKKHTHVDYRWTNEGPHFTKVRRSREWEDNQVEAILALGLEEKVEDVFTAGSGTLQDAISWIQDNKQVLTLGEIEVKNSLSKKYSFEKAEVNYSIKEKFDWFDLKIIITIGQFQIPFQDIAKSIKRGEEFHTLPDRSLFPIPEAWFALAKSLQKSTSNDASYHVNKYQLDILDQIQSKKIKKHLSKLVDIKKEAAESTFVGSLRPYQVRGLSWLMFLKNNYFGGILADDMGLGKTVQTLAFLQKIKLTDQGDLFDKVPSVSLLVAPTSLLFNWLKEANKFTPNLSVHIHAGSKRYSSIEELEKFDLVITSYGLIRNDIELFGEMEFSAIVLDESQNIKNRTAKTSRNIYQLKARHRLALTGTPIENSIKDLWSQMHFLNPGLLGNARQFDEEFVKPIEKENDLKKADKLRALIKPFVLRRTKEEVAGDLPPLTEKTVYCEMTSSQSSIYEETKSTYRNAILKLVEEKGLAKSKLNVLQGLTKLRQMANHPKLSDPSFDGSSGKHDTVIEHIRTGIAQGHKILVFSQFVKYLELLEQDLNDLSSHLLMLTGASTKEQRKSMVQQFQDEEDISIFLISLKAGGTGLNLTAADYVFLVDPWWNPAVEAQARDRSHRIGQRKNVFTYKFISKETVEEKIIRLQSKKSKYAKDIIMSETNVLKNFDTTTLRKLFE